MSKTISNLHFIKQKILKRYILVYHCVILSQLITKNPDKKKMIRAITKRIQSKLFLSHLQICSFSIQLPQREQMEYDVVIVGGGVAGLATAIKLKQQQQLHGKDINVCLIEKGAELGDHVLSGNCFEPRAFDELFPDWRSIKENPPPISTSVTSDNFYFLLNQQKSIKIPNFVFPKTIDNHGNFIISLSQLTKWMGEKAQQYGVDVFSGTPGSQLLYNQNGSVKGIATGDFGISKKGEMKDNFQRGIQIIAKQTVLAEGCRGSLSQIVMKKYNLRDKADPQLYGIGLKQVWQVDANHPHFKPGYLQHTVGWPLDPKTYAGSFLYHMAPNYIHIGLVVGLNYKNPYINPYQQFQRFKTHSQVRKFIEGGQCISYGARALSSGGYFSIPQLTFPGGLMVGCSAGLMNVLKIKGSHTAIKSGIEAGKAIYQKLALQESQQDTQNSVQVHNYQKNMENSWVWDQLKAARNIKNSFKYGLYAGLAYGGVYKLLSGKEPFDLRNSKKDSEMTEKANKHKPITYPKHDRKLTFDLLDNLARSGTNHEHDQPSHLVVKQGKQDKPMISLTEYAAPEQKFCPARVYEFVEDQTGKKKLQINAQNCLHCKTCSIKMIDEYIEWRTPQGNGGPKYNLM